MAHADRLTLTLVFLQADVGYDALRPRFVTRTPRPKLCVDYWLPLLYTSCVD